jgi:hypothetical protein
MIEGVRCKVKGGGLKVAEFGHLIFAPCLLSSDLCPLKNRHLNTETFNL